MLEIVYVKNYILSGVSGFNQLKLILFRWFVAFLATDIACVCFQASDQSKYSLLFRQQISYNFSACKPIRKSIFNKKNISWSQKLEVYHFHHKIFMIA